MIKLSKYFKKTPSPKVSKNKDYSKEIQEALKIHTCVIDSKGSILELSASWEDFTGVPSQVIIDSKFKNIINHYDILDISSYWTSCIENKSNMFRKFRVKNRRGDEEWYSATSKKIQNNRWLIIFKNIDEEKTEIQNRADVFDQTLSNDQDRFKRILESLKIGFWYSDLELKNFLTSDVAKEHLNIPENTRNDDLERIFSNTHPEDKEKIKEALDGAIWNNQKYDIVYRTLKDGETRWIHALGWVEHDEKGNAKTFDGITLNVTDEIKSLERLKDDEWRYKMALNATNEVVYDWDIKKNELVWNESLHNNLGFDKKILNTTINWFYERVHPDDLKEMDKTLYKAFEDCKHYWKHEYRFRKADETYIDIVDSGYIHYNENNEAVRMIGSLYDKTEENKYITKMIEAVKLRDDFLSMASHELRTPLTSMMLQIQLVQRRLERDTADLNLIDTAFKKLARQSKLLTSLIEQMLDVTKISKGKLELRKETIDITEIVKNVVDIYSLNFTEKGISFSEEYQQGLMANVDSFRYEQVVYNMLSNAVKYGDGKPISIKTYKKNNNVVFEIKDEGIGIPQDYLQKIFKLFERAGNTKSISGLGLGLFISNQIIAAHEGLIEVESEAGKGSCFRVHLPAE